MDFNWTNTVLVGSGFVAGVATSVLTGLRGKIESLTVSRSGGLRIHTNSISVAMGIMGKCVDVDAVAKKTIRKGTARLHLLLPEDQDRSTDVMLVNEIAKSVLTSSAYENHHTRELDMDGAESFIDNKVQDIIESLQDVRQKFPELSDELIAVYVRRWAVKIVAPTVRKACKEKLDFYQELHESSHMIESLRSEIRRLIAKNEKYVKNFDELPKRLGITGHTTIMLPERNQRDENFIDIVDSSAE